MSPRGHFGYNGAMPSGYEKSPDYGGPEPTRPGMIVGVLVFIALVGLILLYAAGF